MGTFQKILNKLITPIGIIFLLLILALAFLIKFGSTSGNNSSLVQPTKRTCIPNPKSVLLTPNPSGSGLKISKTTDLASNLQEKNKAYVLILHCDGIIEEFRVDGSKAISDTVPMEPDDYVIMTAPSEAIIGNGPPEPTAFLSNQPTSTFPPTLHATPSNTPPSLLNGYPPPTTPTPTATPNQSPYP